MCISGRSGGHCGVGKRLLEAVLLKQRCTARRPRDRVLKSEHLPLRERLPTDAYCAALRGTR